MLFFIDESGHDHGEAPYEVLAAVAVAERDLWNLIQSIRAAELESFGVHLSGVGVEFKGKKLLKHKTFRHAEQGLPMDANTRRAFAREFLLKGQREAAGGAVEPRLRDEFTAYGQAAIGFVRRALEISARFRVKTFAAIVHPEASRSEDPTLLRRDYGFLFERFFYYLEDRSPNEMGLIVFDELEKAQSRLLIHQMEKYFLRTQKGQQRASRVVPEPFFVHSDLTTAVQLVDIVAYCFNWGLRLANKMTAPVREEIKPLADIAFNMRYVGRRFDEAGTQEWPVYGVFYLDDLRPRDEREE